MNKVLLIDLETSPNLGYIWEKYEQNVLSFVTERDLLSFSYKWEGEKSVKVCSLEECTIKELVGKLHKLFNEAEIIIAHNGDNFDIKMSNTFFINHGFNPPSPYKTIDTLKIARSKFKFNSNKLNDLGEYLGLGKKVETGGFGLWLGCLKGDKKSWALMRKYNKQDVALLEKVYLKLRSWGTNLPTAKVGLVCPACGSSKLQSRGWQVNKVFKSKRFQCQNCSKWSLSSIKIKHNNKEYAK